MNCNLLSPRLTELCKNYNELAIAAMHGVFDIGHCTVIHCDAGGVSLVDQ